MVEEVYLSVVEKNEAYSAAIVNAQLNRRSGRQVTIPAIAASFLLERCSVSELQVDVVTESYVVMASASKAFQRLRQNKAARDAVRILAWVPVGIFFTKHVYSVASVTGASMQPTFNPELQLSPNHSDVVLLDKWGLFQRAFQRGDVVTLWSPQNPELLTTKRIVALEGDMVVPLPPSPPTLIRIPKGHCWVEGDSPAQSRDSNTYGPVPLALITSRVKAVIWPWSHSGLVSPGTGKADGRVHRFNDR